jgi:hypothetical protein
MTLVSFPIILDQDDANAHIGGPVGSFVDYMDALLRGGVSSDDLPVAFLDLYALDFYQAQVRNGGHRQFIGNSGGLLQANLAHSLRGAQMLGLPELAQLLGECRSWCEANPIACDRQDYWNNRPTILSALDRRLYAMEYDDVAYSAFVAAQHETVQAWIEVATEADGYEARNAYRLAAGAWLLMQPDTQRLSGDDVAASLENILRQHARPSGPC